MNICGLQKLSLLDFPGKTAATVFTGGCNLRCPFCHNALLVTAKRIEPLMTEDEFFSFLDKRHGLLDGVCVTGGEPLLQPDIESFIKKIKSGGFSVKLDTNGCFPERLKSLIRSGLIDYIAMDIKNCLNKYPVTVGIENFDTACIKKSIKLIMDSGIPYEFRTTLVEEFHTVDDIKELTKTISGADNYFLQTFVDSGNLIGGGLHPISKDKTEKMKTAAEMYVKNCGIRGQ